MLFSDSIEGHKLRHDEVWPLRDSAKGTGGCWDVPLTAHAYELGKACLALCNAACEARTPEHARHATIAEKEEGWPLGELDEAIWATDAIGCVRNRLRLLNNMLPLDRQLGIHLFEEVRGPCPMHPSMSINTIILYALPF